MTWTMGFLKTAARDMGSQSSRKMLVRRKGISSGMGSSSVAEPKAWPKSMPTSMPLCMLTIKLDRWRSPMPRMYWQMLMVAVERKKSARVVRKASGEAENACSPRRSSCGGTSATFSLNSFSQSFREALFIIAR